VCEGTQDCTGGAWSDCSTSGQDAGTCAECDSGGSPVYDGAQDADCDGFDLAEIATCFNDPDGIDCTWDFAAGFDSVCTAIYTCSEGSQTVESSCNKAACGAECEADADCSTGDGEYCRKNGNCECRIKGDVVVDDSVDVLDLAAAGKAYSSQRGEPEYNEDADLDPLGEGDGVVNMSDMDVVAQNYGKKL
jgi:hypothetical protein